MSNYSSSRIIAFFDDRDRAEQAIRALKDAGFSAHQIGVSMNDDSGSSDREITSSTEKHKHHEGFWERISNFFSEEPDHHEEQTRVSETEGGYGIPQDRMRHFESRYQEGGVFVTVEGEDRRHQAETILQSLDGDTRDYSSEYSGTESVTGSSARQDISGEGEHRIQLLSEQLRVNKERVQRGEVRLRKEVITEQQNIKVPVTREELIVERLEGSDARPVSGEIGADSEIRVPLSEEKVSVDKRPVVREEVRVGKRQVQNTETVSDQVRREELKVERDGDVDIDEGNKDRKKRIA